MARHLSRISSSALAFTLVVGSAAMAGHVEPTVGNKVTIPLINSFHICDPPNTATQFSGTSACAPAVRLDSARSRRRALVR